MSRCVVGVADSVRHGVTREFAIGAATVASPVSYDDVLIAAGVNSISAVCMLLNGIYEKKTLPLARTGLMKGGVVPPGIEPGTQGFSVLCSTN